MQIKLATSLLFSAIFSALATAAPAYETFQGDAKISDITAAQVLQFAPNCPDSEAAASALNDAFRAYGLDTLGQIAGLTAYMAYESGDFVYDKNVFPGRPGQGTKCMLMFPHLYNFAISFPELKPQVLNLSPDGAKTTTGVTSSNYEELFDPDTENKIRELVVSGDKYTYKCAAWFVTSYPGATCDKTVLNSGLEGFKETMNTCFYAAINDDRISKWCATAKALSPGMPPPGC